LKYVAAVDVGYSRTNQYKAVATLIICRYPSMKVVYEDYNVVNDV
jgi:deoxyinosine 3'endonuclease (endonuclease V)